MRWKTRDNHRHKGARDAWPRHHDDHDPGRSRQTSEPGHRERQRVHHAAASEAISIRRGEAGAIIE